MQYEKDGDSYIIYLEQGESIMAKFCLLYTSDAADE